MKDIYKLTLIHLLLFIQTIVIGYLFDFNNKYEIYVRMNSGYAAIISIILLIINVIVFTVLAKKFNVRSSSVIFYYIFILLLFSVLIIDKDYLLSAYKLSTPIELLPLGYLSPIVNIILLPFVFIFDFLYIIGVYDFSYIIIPCFIGLIIVINRKIINN
ncbi:hypothetical protein UT300007_12530 [Clostridium sp. CTA-7]